MSTPIENDASVGDDTDDTAEHNINATMGIAKDIQEAVTEADLFDDVWSERTIDEPNNPESMITFRIEHGGLYYSAQIVPEADVPTD